MSQPPQPISILDARLAEIDRRLGAIQTGLVDDEPELAAAPEPPAEPPKPTAGGPEPTAGGREPTAAPPPPAGIAPAPHESHGAGRPTRREAAELIAELRELAGAHARLLDSMRELVAAYELAIAGADPSEPLAAPATVRELSLSAGPLNSTEALRGFERKLSRIPEVREVEVRGYEGGDRAIVDVHLIDPTS